MKRSNLSLLIIVLLSISFLSLGFLNLKNKNGRCPPEKQCEKCFVSEDKVSEVKEINSTGKNDPIFLYGNLKKEKIPEEFELGDYWYWVYFKEPLLLINNAAGVPIYIEKMQVNPPATKDFYDIDDFVDKNVEVYGYQTFGYAESSVFQIEAIKEK